MSLIVELSGVGWKVTMECSHRVTALYPPARGGHLHTPGTSTVILNTGDSIEDHSGSRGY